MILTLESIKYNQNLFLTDLMAKNQSSEILVVGAISSQTLRSLVGLFIDYSFNAHLTVKDIIML